MEQKWQKALADFEHALQFIPNDTRTIFNRIITLLLTGHIQDALADANKVISLDDKNVNHFVIRSLIYSITDLPNEALADINHAISLDELNERLLANRATIYLKMKNYQDALADINQVISLEREKDEDLYSKRSDIYVSMRMHQEALADINHAISLNGKDAELYTQRAGFYRDMKNYQDALADINHAISLDRKKINERIINKGLMLSYLRRYDEAIECYEGELKEDPNDYILLYNLAVAKARLNGYSNAYPQIESARGVLLAITDTENRSHALYGLGGLKAIEGKNNEALDYLNQAVKLNNHWVLMASHDIAWLDLLTDLRFQSIIFNAH